MGHEMVSLFIIFGCPRWIDHLPIFICKVNLPLSNYTDINPKFIQILNITFTITFSSTAFSLIIFKKSLKSRKVIIYDLYGECSILVKKWPLYLDILSFLVVYNFTSAYLICSCYIYPLIINSAVWRTLVYTRNISKLKPVDLSTWAMTMFVSLIPGDPTTWPLI